ncbi:hypothetical protein [Flavobacterium laiguense]|uniref:DUF4468 domain-containing protein n=1 Tax=Flavobacterium laiguense TaxID=2169409 RepID=A0A2U1JXZ4_9FLAO|nr:hypothetical protein [Flavobacterium laiguense]PWA09829.1 hypothetical protein DB891_06550 [Flavobacterium laiguense]
MKSKFLFLLLFVSSFCFSQSVNDYVAVLVPVKYEFLKSENQYRLNTLTKFNLKKAGFEAFYTNEAIPKEYDRCSMLNVDVSTESGFMVTKLFITFKDCYDKVIFKSEIGKSREKEFDVAYAEALNLAFESVYALHYKFSGATVANNQKAAIASPAIVPVATTAVAVNVSGNTDSDGANVLFAQPIKNGFQLVDNTPKVVMKVYKTTNPSIYLATKETLQGVLISKDNQWFFEYYEKETLMSEKIAVKF